MQKTLWVTALSSCEKIRAWIRMLAVSTYFQPQRTNVISWNVLLPITFLFPPSCLHAYSILTRFLSSGLIVIFFFFVFLFLPSFFFFFFPNLLPFFFFCLKTSHVPLKNISSLFSTNKNMALGFCPSKPPFLDSRAVGSEVCWHWTVKSCKLNGALMAHSFPACALASFLFHAMVSDKLSKPHLLQPFSSRRSLSSKDTFLHKAMLLFQSNQPLQTSLVNISNMVLWSINTDNILIFLILFIELSFTSS